MRRPPTGVPTWVLDPIDGTVNFVYGIPAYAVSVAVQVDGRSLAGAVANVATARCTRRRSGHGAHVRRGAACDAVAVPTSGRRTVNGVGGHRIRLRPATRRRQAAVLAALLPQVRDIRRIGSAALDLCMVAAGRLDAYFEDDLNVWDWAAGALIAAEAGAGCGCRRSAGGRRHGLVVAAAPGIADAFIEALRRAGGLDPPNTFGCSGIRSAGGAVDLGQQRGSAGWVASGRRLASTASMSSLRPAR